MFLEQHPLDQLHSFAFHLKARHFAELKHLQELPQILRSAQQKNLSILAVGEGSNLLFTKDFQGLVLRVKLKGIEYLRSDARYHYLKIAAGENWHRLVCYCLERQLYGLENLALIPGTVGAAPVQNIGAYGATLSDLLVHLEAYDLYTHQGHLLEADACQFSYRDSLFKQQVDRYLITSITLRLEKKWRPLLQYQGLQEALHKRGIHHPKPSEVAAAIMSIRKEKLPDPKVLANAGSFFKNPKLSVPAFAQLQRAHPFLSAQPSVDGVKLSAAQLIEHCGWKNYQHQGIGTYKKHALVLVHYGGQAPEQLLRLAHRIESSVALRFGIALSPEVRIL